MTSILYLDNCNAITAYFDFAGRRAYMSQFFGIEDCYVAHKVGEFTIPKTLIHLNQFRSSLINLFKWKYCTINNSKAILLALANYDERYGAANISNNVAPSSFKDERSVSPVSIRFSPKGKKRARFSDDDDEE